MNITKVIQIAGLSCFMLTSVYAINVPSSNTQQPNYGSSTFVSKPEQQVSAPAKKTAPAASQPAEDADPITTLPSAQTSQNETAALQLAANTAKQGTTSAAAVKHGAANCPAACPQKTGIEVKKEILQKIVNRQVDSSNASEIEQLLGPPCSCITFNPLSADVWTCQWKGDLSSNRLQNTINITFEGGMLAGVTAVRGDGVTYMAQPNSNITVYQPQ